MDNEIAAKSNFKSLILFPAFVIISAMVGLGHIFPLINPNQSSSIPVISGFDDGLNPPKDKDLVVKVVSDIVVDNKNTKWFCADVGIVSFDGESWKLHDGNKDIPNQNLKGVIYASNPEGPELWIASPNGATFARLPINDQSEAITLNPENIGILGKEVVSIAAGKNTIRWFGTDKGISALSEDTWLEPYYEMHYPTRMFRKYKITSMVTNFEGDSLYVGTAGAGVARVYRDEYDGISGASVYAQWGPIIIPSDSILSIFIAPDGTKWFGTEKGIAKHTGNETLENWTVYTTDDGLVDNFVQAISGDNEGNIWFGTKAGLSVFNGSTWISFTTVDGLAGNNVLSITTDHDGAVWIGTDAGITCYDNEKFINY